MYKFIRHPKAFWLTFLIPLLLAVLLVSRVERSIPSATSIGLVAGCQVDFLDTMIQPVYTVALSCPGVDMIRLWPLPVISPWYEDPEAPERPEDQQAGLPRAFLVRIGTELHKKQQEEACRSLPGALRAI